MSDDNEAYNEAFEGLILEQYDAALDALECAAESGQLYFEDGTWCSAVFPDPDGSVIAIAKDVAWWETFCRVMSS